MVLLPPGETKLVHAAEALDGIAAAPIAVASTTSANVTARRAAHPASRRGRGATRVRARRGTGFHRRNRRFPEAPSMVFWRLSSGKNRRNSIGRRAWGAHRPSLLSLASIHRSGWAIACPVLAGAARAVAVPRERGSQGACGGNWCPPIDAPGAARQDGGIATPRWAGSTAPAAPGRGPGRARMAASPECPGRAASACRRRHRRSVLPSLRSLRPRFR